MNRSADIFLYDLQAGVLTETENGYAFRYHDDYLLRSDARPISLSLPLTHKTYTDKRLFPFFDGLIPEGWLLDPENSPSSPGGATAKTTAQKYTWKISANSPTG